MDSHFFISSSKGLILGAWWFNVKYNNVNLLLLLLCNHSPDSKKKTKSRVESDKRMKILFNFSIVFRVQLLG